VGNPENFTEFDIEKFDGADPGIPAGCDYDYTRGYSDGYAEGFEAAVERYEDDAVDEMALTFSHADLALMGVGFLALVIPVGILLARDTRRPPWKSPWS
jgi:hypothetical protein